MLRTIVRALALTALPLAAALPAQSTIHDYTGSVGDSYGQVCDTVGDMDGDGFAEVLVGAWRDDPGGISDAGTVFIYDGATGVEVSAIPGTGVGDHMGYGSSAAGDVNNDGFYDVCAAADEDDILGVGNNAGSATIISGIDGSVIWAWTGDSGGDLFGWSTAAVGDVDGDFIDDVLVSAINDEGGGSPSNAGSITAFSGATGLIIHRIYGSVGNGNLGSKVGLAGDVDADGHNDLIAIQGSLARVFSGADTSVLHDFTVTGGGSLGLDCSGGIDANLDGHADLIVGAGSFSSSTGRLVVFSGADGTILHDITGDNVGDQLGASVAGVGDLNGDGYGDIVAGMPGWDMPASAAGALRAISGKDGSTIFTVTGNNGNDRIGAAVGGGHDVDMDGYPDAIGSATSGDAKSASFTPTGLVPFGTGTPGCDGDQPLLANGVPAVGNAGFALLSSNAPPSTPGLVVIGDTKNVAGFPLLGALLHVSLPPVGGFAFFVGTPAADAKGSMTIPTPIPANPALAGLALAAQLGTIWTAGPCAGTFSSTAGLELTIQ